MDAAFQDQLANWGDYFGYAGTAAATLIGLLFVAVSLRLDIFRNAATADVQHFARLVMLTFLIPFSVSGVALMPHERPLMMAVLLVGLGIAGFVASVRLMREWIRLNPVHNPSSSWLNPDNWRGWAYFSQSVIAFLTLVVIGILILRGNSIAFPILGVVLGWMLVYGAISAWIMVTHAGQSQG